MRTPFLDDVSAAGAAEAEAGSRARLVSPDRLAVCRYRLQDDPDEEDDEDEDDDDDDRDDDDDDEDEDEEEEETWQV
jgi:hypothetical protein